MRSFADAQDDNVAGSGEILGTDLSKKTGRSVPRISYFTIIGGKK
ncbi:MAG: hypothetical protein WBJ13_07880 [Sedimentibacter sp.]